MTDAAHWSDRKNARRAFFALLYFSEGAPIGYIWWAMPTKLRAAGMPVERVAAVIALLTLPWALKFLWAPAVDRLRGPRWGYRAWITVSQIAMGMTLIPLAFLSAEAFVTYSSVLLIAHAVSAATQDVAIDGLAIATIPEHERGSTTGWMHAGMLVGRAVFGGVSLTAERWIGAQAVILILVGCVWFTLAVVWLVPIGRGIEARTRSHTVGLMTITRRIMSRRSTWLALGIALTAGAGFEAIGVLIGPMLSDRGASKELIGLFFAFPVIVLMIAGAMIGGFAADKLGPKRLVSLSVILVGASVVTIALTDKFIEVSGPTIMVLSMPMYLSIGSLTASSYALFMNLSDPMLGGTQFSAYMGATNMCEVWAVALAGKLATNWDYSTGFIVCVGLSMVSLVFVYLLGFPSGEAREGVSSVIDEMTD